MATPPDAAIDLLRIAAGAYIADRLTRRGLTFSRDISLNVELAAPDTWISGPADQICDLLHWLTGDSWSLVLTKDTTPRPAPIPTTHSNIDSHPVSLLSGGLDSFLGALNILPENPDTMFIGHADAANAVVAAQKHVGTFLADAFTPTPSYTRLRLAQQGRKREASSRTRSLMFLSLAVAASTPSRRGTPSSVYVPENGYTSINQPLHVNRGGALSTRSTHPTTIYRFNELLNSLEISASVTNPFVRMTKGEAMKHVAQGIPPTAWERTAAATISCSKLDGARIPGGNANLNCGLCYPCIVRRATFIASGITDKTAYLCETLTGTSRTVLLDRRASDIDAVRYAISRGVDQDAVDADTWPPDYDLDDAADLVQRGLDEIAQVPLP
ncbi:queuosine biosynthesis protein queC [Rhodococcus sp. NCIMB 12038]|uniref:queuosine biosynthesis protein queC n=1 Tax=Rhodococcus sp. NCIMB 12038 TaxID=933800 RepID=UPI00211B379E|nr:queuosine biosynthesis protein queC [Rhodococcus sp. NCIMB 12038]